MPSPRAVSETGVPFASAATLTPLAEPQSVAIAEKAYPGCGKHLAQLLDDIRHERPVRV